MTNKIATWSTESTKPVHVPEYHRLALALFIILSLIAVAIPLFGTSLFGVDLPNHAARLWIECRASDDPIKNMWSIQYGIIPNLAIDVINKPLCGIMNPEQAIRLASALTTIAILGLAWLLSKVLPGGPKPLILLAPALTLNLVTFMGYINYWIGVALFMVFVWFIVAGEPFESDRRPNFLSHVLVANVLGVCLFFCHIFALGLAVIFLFGFRWGQSSRTNVVFRAVDSGVFTGVSFILPLALMLLAPRSGAGFGYNIFSKLRAILAPFLYANIQITGILAALTGTVLLWAFREKILSLDPRLRSAFWASLLFCVMVPSLLFNAVDIDSRSIVALSLLAVAAFGMSSTDARSRTVWMVTGVLGSVAILAQGAAALSTHRTLDRQVAEFRSAIGIIPSGSAVLSAQSSEEPPIPVNLYTHLASYGTRDRRYFNPLEFSGRGMQPMRASQGFACIEAKASKPLDPALIKQLADPSVEPLLNSPQNANVRFAYLWPEHFDYVIYYHFGDPPNFLPDRLQLVRNGSFFSILRVIGSGRRTGRPPCPIG